LIALIDQRLLCAQNGVAERCSGIGRQWTESLSIEFFNQAELVHESRVGGCACGYAFECDGGVADAVGQSGCTGCGGGKCAGRRPLAEQIVQHGFLYIAGDGGILAEGCGQFRGAAGGISQASDHAGALHIGQCLYLRGQRKGVGKLAVERVFDKVNNASQPRSSAATDIAAGFGKDVAIALRGVDGGVAKINVCYLIGVEGEQFVALADAVLVEITPDSEAGEVGVLFIGDAVVVDVEIGQGIETAGRQ